MPCPPWCGKERECGFCRGARERKLLKTKRCKHGYAWCAEHKKRCNGCKADDARKNARKRAEAETPASLGRSLLE